MSTRNTTRSTINSNVKKSPVIGHLFVALTSISKTNGYNIIVYMEHYGICIYTGHFLSK